MARDRSHQVHTFTRRISEAADGRVLFGCSYGTAWAGCAATEVRRPGEPSPFAVSRAKRRNAARVRRFGNAAVEIR